MKQIFKIISDLNRETQLQFISLIFLVVILTIFNSISIFTIAPVVDVLMENDPKDYSSFTNMLMYILNLETLTVAFSFMFFGISLILTGIGSVIVQYMVLKIKYSVVIHIMSEAFAQFFKSKFSFFSESNMGELLNSFQRESDKIGGTIGNIAKFGANLLQVIIFLAVPFYISFKLSLIFILCAIIVCIPIWVVNKRIYPLGVLNTSTANHVSGILHQSFSAAKLIIAYGNQLVTSKRYKNLFTDYANYSYSYANYISYYCVKHWTLFCYVKSTNLM